MGDAWDERRKAQEDSYFENLNKQALARLAVKQGAPARPSPVTGKPMEVITVMGTVIDRCVDSGGIWLDAGELDQLLVSSKEHSPSLADFIKLVPQLNPQGATVTGGKNSPITGKPMNQEKVLGVSIDKCSESGGIWLDASELARLLSSSHQTLSSWILDFFSQVLGKK